MHTTSEEVWAMEVFLPVLELNVNKEWTERDVASEVCWIESVDHL
jgi:hypothetical protein